MTAREFLEECKRNPPQKEVEREMKVREDSEDTYYDRLGELVEEYPIRSPRRGRGLSNL